MRQESGGARRDQQWETLAERYQELFLAVPWPMAITDAAGLVLARNRAAAQTFGDPLPGSSEGAVFGYFASSDRQRARALIVRALARAKATDTRLRLRHSNDPLAVRITPFADAGHGDVRLTWELRRLAPGVASEAPGRGSRPSPAQGLVAEAARIADMLDRLAQLQRNVAQPQFDPHRIADDFAARVVEIVTGTEWCGVSVLDDEGAFRTLGGTGTVVAVLDDAQRAAGQGPTLDALSGRSPVCSADACREWPAFAARAVELPVRGVLSLQFPVSRGLRGALTAWSSRPDAFSLAAQAVLPVIADQIAIALQYADKVSNLQRALLSRQSIGQACGMLMERHGVTSAEAFARLSNASQQGHVKISVLAQQLVDTGVEPAPAGGAWPC